jgi:hypothetical protein
MLTGRRAFSVLQGGEGNASPRMLVTTIGIGPALSGGVLHAPVGAEVVLSGRDLRSAGLESRASASTVSSPRDPAEPDRVVVTVPVGA